MLEKSWVFDGFFSVKPFDDFDVEHMFVIFQAKTCGFCNYEGFR